MELVEFNGIRGCVLKAIMEKNVSKSKPFLINNSMVWHRQKADGNNDFQFSLLSNI